MPSRGARTAARSARELLEVGGVGDRGVAVGGAGALVNGDELESRGEAELAPAELAEGGDGPAAGRAGGEAGRALAGLQLALGERGGLADDDLDEVSELAGELDEAAAAGDVAEVDAEELAVLEGVEGVGVGRAAGAGGLAQHGGGPRGVEGGAVGEDGEEVLVLDAEEVLPQEAADAEGRGQRLENALVGELGE